MFTLRYVAATRYHQNTASGYESDYGNGMDLTYTFNDVNAMTAISDADDSDYAATVTCDANNNITRITETDRSARTTATLTTDFSYDALNRLSYHKTTSYSYSASKTEYVKREHVTDAVGRIVTSTYKSWDSGGSEPAGDSLEHVYNGSRFLQNYDGTSTYGDSWRWAGAQNAHSSPIKSPAPDTSSQLDYNIANNVTPQRRTFVIDTVDAGDQRHLFGQGRVMAKDGSGSGSNWYRGTGSDNTGGDATVYSRVMYEGTVTATDMDRATDVREKGRQGIFGTSDAYAGSYGRVTSESIGRDLNPLGRGDGNAYVAGAMNLGRISPALPKSRSSSGTGNSINNNGCVGCALNPSGNPSNHMRYPSGAELGTVTACPNGGWHFRTSTTAFFDNPYSKECGEYWNAGLDRALFYDPNAEACKELLPCSVLPVHHPNLANGDGGFEPGHTGFDAPCSRRVYKCVATKSAIVEYPCSCGYVPEEILSVTTVVGPDISWWRTQSGTIRLQCRMWILEKILMKLEELTYPQTPGPEFCPQAGAILDGGYFVWIEELCCDTLGPCAVFDVETKISAFGAYPGCFNNWIGAREYVPEPGKTGAGYYGDEGAQVQTNCAEQLDTEMRNAQFAPTKGYTPVCVD